MTAEKTAPKKEDILNAWIMYERLAEGVFEKKEEDQYRLDSNTAGEGNYFGLIKRLVDWKKKTANKNNSDGGAILYCGIFDFKIVAETIKKIFKLPDSYNDLDFKERFSFAIVFNYEMEIDIERTFYTESAYIRYKKALPDWDSRKRMEDNLKEQLKGWFGEIHSADDFNNAVNAMLRQYRIEAGDCWIKATHSIEKDFRDLHSFFINDLGKAKGISTDKLNRYLFGGMKDSRINLDAETPENRKRFEEILQPEKMPLSRFPDSLDRKPYFMQQTAINLSVGRDGPDMRSVNGPPGTGKTTLLEDVFSELVVRQAWYIATYKWEKETEYDSQIQKRVPWTLPEELTDEEIVVASSNNGAVQNIVNELPKIDRIDPELRDAITEADYFLDLSNSEIKEEWAEDKSTGNASKKTAVHHNGTKTNWGLFSKEGGTKDKTGRITNTLIEMNRCLKEKNTPDSKAYERFLEIYNKAAEYRRNMQSLLNYGTEINVCKNEMQRYKEEYETEKKKQVAAAQKIIDAEGQKIWETKDRLAELETDIKSSQEKIQGAKERYTEQAAIYREYKAHKPCIFAFRRRREWKENSGRMLENLQNILNEKDAGEKIKSSLEEERIRNESTISNAERDIKDIKEEYSLWEHEEKRIYETLQAKLNMLQKKLMKTWDWFREESEDGENPEPLNMDLPYEELQKSNPWTTKRYRRLQSEVFISALRARKEFLYRNRKNLAAAAIAWDHQDEYPEGKKRYIAETSWHWINFAIPVISTTFASLGYMFRNIGAETIGHIFMDEAGQALPQAAVGAVFRAKDITAVGDPAQIKPVVILESGTLNMLGSHYGASEKYLSENASVQTLFDEAGEYGYYKDKDKEDWIGIPLWVHRRCASPMFDISNAISYNGCMVQDVSKGMLAGRAHWYDIKGQATDKYNKAQGYFLRKIILNMARKEPDILEKSSKEKVFVITPFRNVANRLVDELDDIGFTKRESGKPSNIGTIHTFQGKEADIVFLVLGADEHSRGAAAWAVREPNMLNVAATRAKKEFYVIGDKNLYRSTGSRYVKDMINIIDNYNGIQHQGNNENKAQDE